MHASFGSSHSNHDVLVGWGRWHMYIIYTIPHHNIICNTLTHSSSNDPSQWVPGSAVKPVQEGVETIHSHVVRRAIVEPGIKK